MPELRDAGAVVLRDYQAATIRAVREHLADPSSGDGAASLPTGSGKTVIFSSLVRDWVESDGLRVAIVAHRFELLEQAEAKLRRVWPDAPVGVVSSGLKRAEHDRQIVVCGVQTAARRLDRLGAFDVLVIDEAHLVPNSKDTQFRSLIDGLREANPAMRVIGFTATPYRLDGGLIYGKGKPFARLIHEVPIVDLIARGFLCPLTTRGAAAQHSTEGIALRGGEFVRGDLERAASDDELVDRAVAELLMHAGDRSTVLVFCCGVEHAHKVRDALRAAGEDAETITGDTPKEERAGILERFGSGSLRFLTNVETLTTGLDVERIDCIACLRPTMSTGLWCQMIGRGLRPHPSKRDTLVLDFTDNSVRHGPIDCPDVQRVRPRSSKFQRVAARTCPECRSILGLSLDRCPNCGHVFEVNKRQVRHGERPTMAELLGIASGIYEVRGVMVRRQDSKANGVPMLRVSYRVGQGRHDWASEFVLLEHDGFAGQKARAWWSERFGHPVPATVADALRIPDLAERIRERTEAVKLNTAQPFPLVSHLLREEEPACAATQ